MTNYSQIGRGQGHVTHFKILGLHYIFVVGEAVLFTFGMQIDNDKSLHVRDRLSLKGVCWGHVTSFNFGK